MNYFMIAQIAGVLSTVVSIIIVQFKKINHILIGEILSNLTVAASYILLGGFSGASVCSVACIHTGSVFFCNKNDKAVPIVLTVFFELCYIACSALSYTGTVDIISCVAALFFGLAVIQKNAAKYRILMLANSALWIIYDILTKAYTTTVTHTFFAISLIIAMLRLDVAKGK